MTYVLRFLHFWYDFIVGDDWTIAAGVIIVLAVSGFLARGDFHLWWLTPLAVALLLAVSVWRVAHKS